jgi:hypothetical protein
MDMLLLYAGFSYEDSQRKLSQDELKAVFDANLLLENPFTSQDKRATFHCIDRNTTPICDISGVLFIVSNFTDCGDSGEGNYLVIHDKKVIASIFWDESCEKQFLLLIKDFAMKYLMAKLGVADLHWTSQCNKSLRCVKECIDHIDDPDYEVDYDVDYDEM